MDVCGVSFKPNEVDEMFATLGLNQDDPCFVAERLRRYIPQHSRLVEHPDWDGTAKDFYTDTELRDLFQSTRGADPQNNPDFVAMVDQYFIPATDGYRPKWLDSNIPTMAKQAVSGSAISTS